MRVCDINARSSSGLRFLKVIKENGRKSLIYRRSTREAVLISIGMRIDINELKKHELIKIGD